MALVFMLYVFLVYREVQRIIGNLIRVGAGILRKINYFINWESWQRHMLLMHRIKKKRSVCFTSLSNRKTWDSCTFHEDIGFKKKNRKQKLRNREGIQ